MFYTRVGQFVDVRALRGDEIRRFSVKVDARPADEPMQIVEPVEQADSRSDNPLKAKVS
jgi:hypothetical protein